MLGDEATCGKYREFDDSAFLPHAHLGFCIERIDDLSDVLCLHVHQVRDVFVHPGAFHLVGKAIGQGIVECSGQATRLGHLRFLQIKGFIEDFSGL